MTILLLESIHIDAQHVLAAHDTIVPAAHRYDVDAIRVVALVTRGRAGVGAAEFARYPNLRVIARCGVGVEHIDTALAAQCGIPIVYSPGTMTIAVAEHTLLLMLASARQLHQIASAVDAGNWAIRNTYNGIELSGQTLGVVGTGAIGQRVALYGAMLGMHVVTWNRSAQAGMRHISLDDLLAIADVVSLHVALAPATQHLIGARELARMKPGSVLINTARGGLIDQSALMAALAAGRPAYFAADALASEPPAAAEPLLGHPQTVITPHCAALTDTTYRAVCLRIARNVVAILRDEQPEAGTLYIHPV